MCPVAAESKNSKSSSKKKINKKVNPNLDSINQEENKFNSQNIENSSELNESNVSTSDDFNDSEEEGKGIGNIKIGPKGIYTEDSIRVYLQ